MVAVIVHRIGVHVTDAEDVDEHAKKRGNKQKHHGDVIDVYSYIERICFNC